MSGTVSGTVSETIPVTAPGPTPKDFATDQDVRWCPGCGDYAILKAVQRTLADLGAAPARTVFVSGIGCAARFPYYMATYGFHTIHGRAPAIATGIKLANPDLDVWIVSGDGDALSIGGNHTLHLLRRNVDVNFLLFNNEIYGLTKGQASPTSRVGTHSPSTPGGVLDPPVSAGAFALGAGARFLARSADTLQQHMPGVLARAHAHTGASCVEIFQNCIVYNDGAFSHFMDKAHAADRQLFLRHGDPMRFGRDGRRGLRLAPGRLALEAVTIGENGVADTDILRHDETDAAMAMLLARMAPPALPVALGVIYCDPAPSQQQRLAAVRPTGRSDLDSLIRRAPVWRVDG